MKILNGIASKQRATAGKRGVKNKAVVFHFCAKSNVPVFPIGSAGPDYGLSTG